MQWLRTSNYKIFIILLGFKNLWNLKIVFKTKLKMFIQMFPMIFQSSRGPRKLRCDVPSGTTQG